MSKDKRIILRVSSEEYAQIEANAGQNSISSYLRKQGLEYARERNTWSTALLGLFDDKFYAQLSIRANSTDPERIYNFIKNAVLSYKPKSIEYLYEGWRVISRAYSDEMNEEYVYIEKDGQKTTVGESSPGWHLVEDLDIGEVITYAKE